MKGFNEFIGEGQSDWAEWPVRQRLTSEQCQVIENWIDANPRFIQPGDEDYSSVDQLAISANEEETVLGRQANIKRYSAPAGIDVIKIKSAFGDGEVLALVIRKSDLLKVREAASPEKPWRHIGAGAMNTINNLFGRNWVGINRDRDPEDWAIITDKIVKNRKSDWQGGDGVQYDMWLYMPKPGPWVLWLEDGKTGWYIMSSQEQLEKIRRADLDTWDMDDWVHDF